MRKLTVNAIKMFLQEPVVEFTRPDGGRSIKTISLLDKEEVELTKDVLMLKVLPKLNAEKEQVVKKSNRDESFADRLNRIISQREEISNNELAKRAGISDRYLKRLRSGKCKNPTLKIVYKLADVLECDATELV